MRPASYKSIPFVGRDSQLAALNAYGKAAFEQNQGKVIFLLGEAGIGKTTLARHFSQMIQEKYPHIRYAYASCSEKTGEISPYTPFVQLHQNLLEQEASQVDDRNAKDNWLFDYAQEVGPDFFDIIPIAGPALKVLFKSTTFAFKKHHDQSVNSIQRELPSKLAQINVFQKVTDSLLFIANRYPLLLFVDDWHWADESSTNLLFHLSRQIIDAPILFLATFRPHEAEARQHPILAVKAEMHRYHLCADISIDFLSQASIIDYLNQRFPATQFEPSFIAWLQKITNGNALFLNEYIELLLEEKRLTDKGQLVGNWQEIHPPESVEGVIRSRIQYLDDEARRLLLYASIEGERFSTLFLERVLKLTRLSLLAQLRNIEKTHQLISEKGKQLIYQQQTIVYQFVHVIVYQTFYNELSEGERVELSRMLLELQGEFFEKIDAATQSQMLPQLIELAEITSDYQAKAKYALRAANDAAESYAHVEVIKQCDTGLRALDNLPETSVTEALRMDLLFRQAHTRWWFMGEWKQAIEDLRQIERIAIKQKDRNQLIRAYDRIGYIHHLREEYDQAIESFKKALSIEDLKPSDLIGIYSRLSNVYQTRKNYDQALEWAQKVQKIREGLGHQADEAYSLIHIGLICSESGNYEKGLEYAQKALTISERFGDEYVRAVIYNQTALMQLRARRDYDNALTLLQKAVAINQKRNDQMLLAVNYHNVANIYRMREEYDQALQWFQRVVSIREKLRDLRNLALTWNIMGTIAMAQEQFEKAIDFFTRAHDMFLQIGLPNDASETEKNILEMKSKQRY